MSGIKTLVVACDIVSPYGWGVNAFWNGLLSGKTAIGLLERFPTNSLMSPNAAVIPGLTSHGDETLVIQMLKPLLTKKKDSIPDDAFLILATTTGEIEYVERHCQNGLQDAEENLPERLLQKVTRMAGLRRSGMVISAACASSGAAVARAAAMICDGDHDCVLVVACDCVSAFVASGFSCLMALDKDMARPFDKNRGGLSMGEAGAYMLLMSDQRASFEKRPILGEIAGWGLSNDAYHMTSPLVDGSGLALAIQKALQKARISGATAGSLCAHGTGTPSNDAMEMRAFKTVFGLHGIPTYSVKGAIGHTMGAAGLVDLIVTLQSLKAGISPATVNLLEVDDEALGWVFPEPITLKSDVAVSTNSGFGGVNCALVVRG